MLNNKLKNDIIKTANSLRVAHKESGSSDNLVEINYGLSYVALNLPNGKTYFFQNDEGSNMLENIVTGGNKFSVSPEDYLLYISQSW